jgi:hypothetical protein
MVDCIQGTEDGEPRITGPLTTDGEAAGEKLKGEGKGTTGLRDRGTSAEILTR